MANHCLSTVFRRAVLLVTAAWLLAGTSFPGHALPAYPQALPAQALREQPLRDGGVYNMYPEAPEPAAIAPPRGYKPFYISHWGRHGARYDVGGYDRILGWLEGAHEAGALTAFGETVRERYVRMYPSVREGDLTLLGQDQQRGIAHRMFRRYRNVFRRAPRLEAVSSTSGRCIMTMSVFCQQMTAEMPSLSVQMDAGERYNAYMRPSSASNPHYPPYGAVRKGGPGLEAYEADLQRLRDRMDPGPFVARLFADPSYADGLCGGDLRELADAFYFLAASTRCIGSEESFDDIFTPAEWYALWEADSFQYYAHFGPGPYFKGLQWACADTLLSDILTKADADIASGAVGARCRFGHDTGLMSLLALLGAEGFATQAGCAEEAAAAWQNWRFPKSVNLQWIFYRNRQGRILVRLLLNESEDLKLPVGDGPYYEWTELRAYCLERLAVAQTLLQSE